MVANVTGGGGGGGRRRAGRRAGAPMAEINVTPFVDVMLVLLIIFMVAAPLLTAGIPVNLPEAPAEPLPVDRQVKPVVVEVDAEGAIYFEREEVPLDGLIPAIRSELEARVAAGEIDAEQAGELMVLINADGENTYTRVAQVMGLLNSNGFRKIGLPTNAQAAGVGAAPAATEDE